MSVHNSQQDALLTSQVACPAAAATVYAPATGGFDLGLNRKTWKEEIRVDVPALTAQTDTTKNLTFLVEDSADNSSFTAVAALGSQSVPGVASTGSLATSLYWPVPRDIRQYVRINGTLTTGGGAITGSKFTALVLPL